MTKVELYPLKKSPKDMLELIRVFNATNLTSRMLKYKEWIDKNGIEATLNSNTTITFKNEDDAIMFKLTFGL